MGRNSAFDHAGNVAIALAAGAVGYVFSQRAVFLLVPVFGLLAGMAVLSTPAAAINHDRARDLGESTDTTGSGALGYGILFKSRPLVIFGLCVMLFHLANAALLPLVGQKLAAAHPKEATAMMSACIVAAQPVMLPIALLVGCTADRWGRKPLFLAGFTILPIRAVLYTFSNNSVWLISVQVLDGVGAGIFGALTPLVIADIMRGTGRYNLAQGAIATVQGIGASLSGLAAGVIVDHSATALLFSPRGPPRWWHWWCSHCGCRKRRSGTRQPRGPLPGRMMQVGAAQYSWRVGRNRISFTSISSGWLTAKTTARANEAAGIAIS
jgi:Na+/melibiose symporter-like transporter